MAQKRTFTRQQKPVTEPKVTKVTKAPKVTKAAKVAEVTEVKSVAIPVRNFQPRLPVNGKKTEVPKPPKRSKFKLWMLLLLGFIGVVIALSLTLWWYISAFEQASGAKAAKLFNEFSAGANQDLFAQSPEYNLLLLGTDTFSNQSGPALTDTIMLLSLKANRRVYLLALPRDVWIASLQTKLNALYYYGEESEDTTGPELVKSVVKEMTGKDIHHHVVLNLDSVKDLVDLLGGLTLTVDRAFVDEKYPREGSATDSADFMTVSFAAGQQQMSGEKVLQYIRSRQSANPEEGNDQARLQRQRKVLEALNQRATQATLVTQPQLLGKLYGLWQAQVNTDLTDRELVALARFFGASPQLMQLEIPVQTVNQSGLLVNPPVAKYQQWVYEPTDPTWESVRQWLGEQGL